MNSSNFLGEVWPATGTYCVVAIPTDNRRNVKHSFCQSIAEADDKIEALDAAGNDVYFAVSSFQPGANNRTQDLAAEAKSFWLDLDCGEGKPYAEQGDALVALRSFCHSVGLPLPWVVNSGNGIHAYWVLDEAVSTSVWLPEAQRLKAACERYELYADPAVTADSARILRVPGTHNRKNTEAPKQVRVLREGPPIAFETMQKALSSVPEPAPARIPTTDTSELSETAKALMGNKQSRFSTIATRSLKGTGCGFIKHALESQSTLEEPAWRAALSIAHHCVDGKTSIQTLSKEHPDYSPSATREKAQQTKGPYTCAVIRGLAPDACKGCPHSITSPIQLGAEVARAEPEILALPDSPPPMPLPSLDHADLFADDMESPEEPPEPAKAAPIVASYSPPFPFFRGKHGGVYCENTDGDGNRADLLVYEYDFYPVKRVMDPKDGEAVMFRLHLPLDGCREFMVPLRTVTSTDKFRQLLGEQGVAAGAKQAGAIMSYSISFIKELQRKAKAEEARLQFGWADADKAFIVGNRSYNKSGGYIHSPASSATSDLIGSFDPKGTIKEWKKIINALSVPGLEPLQFAALCGFAAPLMKFTGVRGATVNLLSNGSGTGKTTAEKIALSVFGCPDDTMLIADDTYMARLHRFGVMNNLCVMSDEMTNTPVEVLSNLVYAVTHGRGRHRMERDSNAERINSTTWCTINLTNSNSSIISKMAKFKSRADGEMMRLLELHVDRIVIPNGDITFNTMHDNYGVAGEVYAPWLVVNHSKIPELLAKQMQIIYSRVGKQGEERFWVALISAVLVGGRIARGLGLHDLDMKALEDWACDLILRLRGVVEEESIDAQSLIGEFLNDKAHEILGIGTTVNAMTGNNIFHEPRGKTVARLETGTRRMYITKKDFRTYCVDRQFTMSEALAEASLPGAAYQYVGSEKKRLLAGTGLNVPPVSTLVFEFDEENAKHIESQLTVAAHLDD